MEIVRQLEEYCQDLESKIITKRKKACEDLSDILTNSATIDCLNKKQFITWETILKCIQTCLLKESERKAEEYRKKGNTISFGHPIGDLFAKYIRVAIKQDVDLDIDNLITFLISTLNTEISKKCYLNIFLKILNDSILSNWKCRSYLTSQNWIDLYKFLKTLNSDRDFIQIESINLILQWGPQYNFPMQILRTEFEYIKELGRKIKSNCPKPQQRATLEILFNFCQQLASDERKSCCELGESICGNILELYEIYGRVDKIKLQIIKFLLLQTVIHNPKGSKCEVDDLAYSNSKETWLSYLKRIYNLLCCEIEAHVTIVNKNPILFLNNTKQQIVEIDSDFTELFVEVSHQLFLTSNSCSSSMDNEERPSKRQRVDAANFEGLIVKIKETNFWGWIWLTGSLIYKYPKIGNKDENNQLLEVLTRLLIDVKEDTDLRSHLCRILCILDGAVSEDCRLENWEQVGKTALRSVGLNQNDWYNQKLVRQLIKRNLIQSDNFFQNYKPSILKITPANLQTLDFALQHYNFTDTDRKLKQDLISWLISNIPNCDNDPEFATKIGQTLLYLILKQYPKPNDYSQNSHLNNWEIIENTYDVAHFNQLLLPQLQQEKNSTVSLYYLDEKFYQFVLVELYNITIQQNLLIDAIIQFTFLSYLENFGLYSSFNIINSELYQNCIQKIKTFSEKIIEDSNKTVDENRQQHLGVIVKQLTVLFKIKISKCLARQLRDSIEQNLLKMLFRILNNESVDNSLKYSTMECLAFYCLVPGIENVAEFQLRALEAIVKKSYNFANLNDYNLVLTFLRNLIHCEPEYIHDDIQMLIFNQFSDICSVRYRCSTGADEVLKLYLDIFRFISDVCKPSFIEFLYVFYTYRNNYGPEVQISLLNCMGSLYEHDVECKYACWNNEEVVLKLSEFLLSPYQTVRFAAIKNLAKFFKLASKSNTLKNFHRQEIIFAQIKELGPQIGELDEHITITQLYASIIVTSHIWIEEVLFSLLNLQLTSQKLQKILNLISVELQFETTLQFIETYLETIYSKWPLIKISSFPFGIYAENISPTEFFCRYFPKICQNLLGIDPKIFAKIGQNLKTTEFDIVKSITPKLFSYIVAKDGQNWKCNKIYNYLQSIFQSSDNDFQKFLRDNIEKILIYLIEYVADEQNYKEKFGSDNVFFSKFADIRLNLPQFLSSIQEIDRFAFNGVMMETILKNPVFMHYILLNLKLKIFNSIVLISKMRYFHHFTIIIDILLENLQETNDYLINDIIVTLLNFSKVSTTKFRNITLKYLDNFVRIALPKFGATLKNYFTRIIGTLKNLPNLTPTTMDILQFLIVDNLEMFEDQIAKLENFPENLQNFHNLHYKIKYHNKIVTLRDEIEQFLQFENYNEQNIKHIRQLLSSKKEELGLLYPNVESKRQFSEQSKSSILHKLICLLIKLSKSSNVRVEAMRCLGEIGPSDLVFLVLQPESPISDPKLTVAELVTGHFIEELSTFLNESNLNLISATSNVLFQIMDTKESRTWLNFSKFDTQNLSPFLFRKTTKKWNFTIDEDRLLQLDDNVWITTDTHPIWIKNLVVNILGVFQNLEYFGALVKICELKYEFAEFLLPLLTMLLVNSSYNVAKIFSKNIQNFFEKHWQNSLAQQPIQDVTINTNSVQVMLNVIHFVRLESTVRLASRMLDLNFLHIAKGANFIGAHFWALFYAELWCKEQCSNYFEDYLTASSGRTQLDIIYENIDEIPARVLHTILQKGYKSIGEKDAFLGCGTSLLLHPEVRIEHYKGQEKWDQVVEFYENSLNNSQTARLLSDSLKHRNLYQLALFSSKSCVEQEPDYECLWRLSHWNHQHPISSTATITEEAKFEKFKFYAMKSIHDHDNFNFEQSIENLRHTISKNLSDCNLEISQNFYKILTQLQAMEELEDYSLALISETDELDQLLIKWKIQDSINYNDFQYLEPIKTQRIVLLKMLTHNIGHRNYYYNMLLSLAAYARLEGQCSVATRALMELRQYTNELNEELKAQLQVEEAEVCWKIQDGVSAKVILRQLCSNENIDPRVHGLALKMTGKWLVESSSENRQTIIDDYFMKSLDLFENSNTFDNNQKLIVDTHWDLANFADKEYQTIMAHIKSDHFQRKIKNMKEIRQSIDQISQLEREKNRDIDRNLIIRERSWKIDDVEIKNIEKEKNTLLELALKYYLLTLKESEEHNVAIFRLTSLLLDNRKNNIIQGIIEEHLPAIPSHKFITILPQIIPHISTNSPDWVSELINDIIVNCAIKHPHHTLSFILSLVYATKDQEYTSKVKKNGSNQDPRSISARYLLEKVKKHNQHLLGLIKKMEKLWEALIELAYHEEAIDNPDRAINISRTLKIRNIKQFEEVLVPIVDLQVNKNCNYENIVGIQEFSNNFSFVGGINAPKRLICVGTDGIKRNLLVKGKDDLRQDAVMQQVFTILNSLLNYNKETKNLLIRTYKVVPLSRRSGILEWVDQSITIGLYLIGDERKRIEGAHTKFRPKDITPKECKRLYAQSAKDFPERRLKNYKKICQQFRPIFHKFFETKFLQPTVWYERRRAFIHSVATTSITGYILGIGDRHLNNILIDENTAEVIHIDFGIAFEQGRVLPTPETVPFRLTRDIVDGMGVSGIEGVFRKSCEKTLQVLRRNSQTIMSILEVLLYDPLYMWAISTSEANKRQRDEEDVDINMTTYGQDEKSKDINAAADRALLRLRAKLQGTEHGNPMTVEHQIGTLIQQAMDPSNLCRLFQGWQPYV